jgi:hypothetical protein
MKRDSPTQSRYYRELVAIWLHCLDLTPVASLLGPWGTHREFLQINHGNINFIKKSKSKKLDWSREGQRAQ